MSAETKSGSPTSGSGTSCEGILKWPSSCTGSPRPLPARTQLIPPSPARPVQLYYRLYSDLRGRNRYICLVVKRERDYSFILTGYLGRSIKGEGP